jgi:hypothetical protein
MDDEALVRELLGGFQGGLSHRFGIDSACLVVPSLVKPDINRLVKLDTPSVAVLLKLEVNRYVDRIVGSIESP